MNEYKLFSILFLCLCFWRYVSLFFVVNDIVPKKETSSSPFGTFPGMGTPSGIGRIKSKMTPRLIVFTIIGLVLFAPLAYGGYLLTLLNQP